MADPRRVGARFLIPRTGRRTILGHGLVLMVLSTTRRLWAVMRPSDSPNRPDPPHQTAPTDLRGQISAPLRYRPLARPVLVSLAELATPWRARPFVADALTLASAAKPNQPIRISGMVVRTATGDDQPDRFRAVCVQCPHEHCDVDFMSDASNLPPDVVTEIGHAVKDPVYLCPCHNSTFTAAEGERLAGPAPRGLYRFRVTSVSGTAVEIGEVEEDLLVFG